MICLEALVINLFLYFSDTITNITCITSNSSSTTVRGEGAVVVRIDGYTETALGFDYDNNPTFSSISPLFSFQR